MDKYVQLFALPFAGGNSLSFMKLSRFIDKRIELVPIEYSGRGSRSDEDLIDDYDIFRQDVVDFIVGKRNREVPYALLGYSMGSALAFDIASRNLLVDKPVYCFFCAEGSLLYDNPTRKYADFADAEFFNCISEMGGLDERILSNPNLRDSYMKLIKTDYGILGQFTYNHLQAPCDAAVLYSCNDKTCVHMDDWQTLVEGKADFYQIGEDHFFIKKEYEKVADIINMELSAYMTRN